jgi:NADH-quinone oxidoreductase subunit N
MMEVNYAALLPEIALLAGAVTVLLTGSFLPRLRQGPTRIIATVALLAAAGFGIAQAVAPSSTIFEGTYALDPATATVRIVAPLGALAVLLLGRPELLGSARESETSSLLLLATLGTVVLAGANDLLIVSTGYLLGSIPLYALIGIGRSERAAEASLKTYLLGALLGVTLLGGIVVLSGVGGSTTYAGLARGLVNAPSAAVALGAVAVLLGLLFKAGGVPGHFWVPDATEASSRAIAAFLTTVPKIGALIAIARFAAMLPPTIDMPLLIGLLAAASMTVGNLAAFWQTDVRRMLGWSTVSQVGYLLLPVAVVQDQRTAVPALLVYLVCYTITNIAAFAVVAALPERRAVDDWVGAARARPLLTAALIISLLSLVGTPPTAVFFGKLAVFTTAWSGGLGWLVAVAALNTVASLFYYLRWISVTVRPAQDPPPVPERSQRAPATIAIGLTIAVLGAGVMLFPLVASGAALAK